MSQLPPLPEPVLFVEPPAASVIIFDTWGKPFCEVAPDGQVSIDWPETERVAALTDSTASTIAKALVFAREQARADLLADALRYRFIRDYCSGEPRVGDIAPAIQLFALQGKAEEAWNETAVASNHLGDTIDAAIAAMKGQA